MPITSTNHPNAFFNCSLLIFFASCEPIKIPVIASVVTMPNNFQSITKWPISPTKPMSELAAMMSKEVATASLVLLCGLNMKEAVATSLLIIAANSLIGFIGDIGHFVIDWKLLGIVTALAITGILVGSQLAKKINNEQLKKAFGWFVLVMGIYIIVKELFL